MLWLKNYPSEDSDLIFAFDLTVQVHYTLCLQVSSALAFANSLDPDEAQCFVKTYLNPGLIFTILGQWPIPLELGILARKQPKLGIF